MDNSLFSLNLRRKRKAKGLTQVGLGQLCGCAQGHVSNLERGVVGPSMQILDRIASVLGVTAAELLVMEAEEGPSGPGTVTEGIPVINERSPARLVPPTLENGRAIGDSPTVLCLSGVRSAEAFACYLPDDSMTPEFHKGDLVVFSLARRPSDGQACLVDLGEGQVVFRTALELPKSGWRLQPANPRYVPTVLAKASKARMWPAIGRWHLLRPPQAVARAKR